MFDILKNFTVKVLIATDPDAPHLAEALLQELTALPQSKARFSFRREADDYALPVRSVWRQGFLLYKDIHSMLKQPRFVLHVEQLAEEGKTKSMVERMFAQVEDTIRRQQLAQNSMCLVYCVVNTEPALEKLVEEEVSRGPLPIKVKFKGRSNSMEVLSKLQSQMCDQLNKLIESRLRVIEKDKTLNRMFLAYLYRDLYFEGVKTELLAKAVQQFADEAKKALTIPEPVERAASVGELRICASVLVLRHVIKLFQERKSIEQARTQVLSLLSRFSFKPQDELGRAEQYYWKAQVLKYLSSNKTCKEVKELAFQRVFYYFKLVEAFSGAPQSAFRKEEQYYFGRYQVNPQVVGESVREQKLKQFRIEDIVQTAQAQLLATMKTLDSTNLMHAKFRLDVCQLLRHVPPLDALAHPSLHLLRPDRAAEILRENIEDAAQKRQFLLRQISCAILRGNGVGSLLKALQELPGQLPLRQATYEVGVESKLLNATCEISRRELQLSEQVCLQLVLWVQECCRTLISSVTVEFSFSEFQAEFGVEDFRKENGFLILDYRRRVPELRVEGLPILAVRGVSLRLHPCGHTEIALRLASLHFPKSRSVIIKDQIESAFSLNIGMEEVVFIGQKVRLSIELAMNEPGDCALQSFEVALETNDNSRVVVRRAEDKTLLDCQSWQWQGPGEELLNWKRYLTWSQVKSDTLRISLGLTFVVTRLEKGRQVTYTRLIKKQLTRPVEVRKLFDFQFSARWLNQQDSLQFGIKRGSNAEAILPAREMCSLQFYMRPAVSVKVKMLPLVLDEKVQVVRGFNTQQFFLQEGVWTKFVALVRSLETAHLEVKAEFLWHRQKLAICETQALFLRPPFIRFVNEGVRVLINYPKEVMLHSKVLLTYEVQNLDKAKHMISLIYARGQKPFAPVGKNSVLCNLANESRLRIEFVMIAIEVGRFSLPGMEIVNIDSKKTVWSRKTGPNCNIFRKQ